MDFIAPDTDRFAGRAGCFVEGGPNGLAAVGDDQFWAGDSDSKLRVIDIPSRKIIATIGTGGEKRVDELAYDPQDHVVVAVNNEVVLPFVSFVSTANGHRIVGKLSIPQATDGLEQPLWNPADGLVYLSVPVLNHRKARGGIAVINPRTHRLIGLIPVHQCMPAGLALGPNGRALVGCSDDAVANTDGPVLGVVGAKAGIWLHNLPTGKDAHSVAAGPRNSKVFVPIAATQKVKGCSRGCVEVFVWK